MSTPTTNYAFQKPVVGGESNAWGTELNANWDSIDSILHTVSGVASAALPAATYTAAGILTLVKTVDGSGSGLDADTVDGKDSTYFQSASNINTGTLATARLLASGAGTPLRWTNAVSSANVTVSTSAPAGGANGDLWLQY